MDKTLRIGNSRTFGGRVFGVYCRIQIRNEELSITGVEGPLPGGNCLGSAGQIVADLLSVEDLAPGWTEELLVAFRNVWQKWHLNNMRAECGHQQILGWTYSTHCGRDCPVCSYPIGTQWLKEALPAAVVEFLAALPDADRVPAWI
jgi:hypothetical protein